MELIVKGVIHNCQNLHARTKSTVLIGPLPPPESVQEKSLICAKYRSTFVRSL
jgi:hypothetical protein